MFGNNKIFVLLVIAVLFFGCISMPTSTLQKNDTVKTTGGGTAAQTEKIKLLPTDVEGNLGEKLSNNHLELTVNSFEYVDVLDKNEQVKSEGKFLLLNVTIKNLDTAAVDWFGPFSIHISKSAQYGVSCKTNALDYALGAIATTKLAADEERTGLVVCDIPIESNMAIAVLNDKIPNSIKSKYTNDSAYGVITVNVIEYANKDLSSTGKVGEFVGNEYTVFDIKINSFEYVDSIPGLTVPKKCYYPKGSVSANNPCRLLILDITVKNKAKYEVSQSFSLGRFTILLGKDSTNIKNSQVGYDAKNNEFVFFNDDVSVPLKYYSDAYTDTIDLKKIKPGETRTGKIVYVIPKVDTLSTDGTNQEFYRYFPYEQGEIRIPLKAS